MKHIRKKLLSLALTGMLFLQPVEISADTVSQNAIVEDQGLSQFVSSYQDIDEEAPPIASASYAAKMYGATAWETASNLPAAYRADEEGYVAQAYRNQNPFGTCWAFSALAACESSMLRKGLESSDTINYSESQLAYYFYNKSENMIDELDQVTGDYTYPMGRHYLQRGGNNSFTRWHLASWAGPVREDREMYLYDTLRSSEWRQYDEKIEKYISSYTMPDEAEYMYGQNACHVQNVFSINTEDETSMKNMIKDYGSVVISYHSSEEKKYDNMAVGDSSKINDEGSYYCPDKMDTNHAVQVIGWDDNYPKENFVYTPTADGAWLVRNSWGAENKVRAECGLFWLSYEDATLSSVAYVFDAEGADNYDHIYQYDGASGNEIDEMKKVANVYEAKANAEKNEQICAVAIGVADIEFPYTVKVYTYQEGTEVTEQNLTEGELRCSQNGSFQYAGYHTVVLDNPVTVFAGQKYAVVFEFEKEIQVYCDDTYTNSDWIGFHSVTTAGKSFAAYGNWGFYDLTQLQDSKVARVKAFTRDCDEVTSISFTQTSFECSVGETLQLTPVLTGGDSSIVLWASADEAIASVDGNGIVTGVHPGTVAITAKYEGKSTSCSITVKEVETTEPEKPPIEEPEKPPIEEPENPPIEEPENPPTQEPTNPTVGQQTEDSTEQPIGQEFSIGTNQYKIISDSAVSYVGVTVKKSKVRKVTIPSQVTYQGRSYQVTEIGDSALSGCKKLTSVVIGKNVTQIGKKAFYSCTKLKKVTIKATALKKVGSKAFYKLKKGAVIKVPRKKRTAYTKLLKKRKNKDTTISV